MARFRIDRVDGSVHYADADRLIQSEGTLALERRTADIWLPVLEVPVDEIIGLSRRHTELSGAWTWGQVYP